MDDREAEVLANQFAGCVAEAMDEDMPEPYVPTDDDETAFAKATHHMASGRMWYRSTEMMPEPGTEILVWLNHIKDFCIATVMKDGVVKTSYHSWKLEGFWMPKPEGPKE